MGRTRLPIHLSNVICPCHFLKFFYSFSINQVDANANTSTAKDPTHTFIGSPGNGIQSFSVKLTVTNPNGCTITSSGSVSTKQLPDSKLGGNNPTILLACRILNNALPARQFLPLQINLQQKLANSIIKPRVPRNLF